MKAVKKFIRLFGNIQLYAGVLCLLVIIVSVTAGVFCRKVLNSPLGWVEELCTFMFVYLAFFGASVAAMNGKHVCADFLTGKLPEDKMKVLIVIQRVLILILLAVMFLGACILQPKMMKHSSTSLDIPKNIYYLPIMISSFYMFVVYGVELIETITGKKGEE
ncbi:MAG: TRAP transporter small permease [Candidatus Limivivens sp.]|nr:TRAP transporter small permease [Candidatus Limivivens sp.]